MAYRDEIASLGADFHWDFDGDGNDQISTLHASTSGGIFTDSAITKDATNCYTVNSVNDYAQIANNASVNQSAQERKAFCGWFSPTAFVAYPVRIYGEGEATTLFHFVMGYGNQVMFEAVEATNFPTGLQVYGPSLQPNRVYHLCAIFSGNNYDNEVKFFVDGVEQLNADPSDRAPDTADLDSRGQGRWADPATTTGPTLGGDTVLQQAAANGYYNHWASWGDEADALLTDTEIREILFEQGALAEETISTDTEANMQTDVDALTNQPDAACCVEVEAVTGGGDFELTSDITFDEKASIHVRYNGTADTLTWINVSGGAASIGSAPFGGTLIIKTRQTLTVTVLDAVSGAAVVGARVYITADTGGPETAGTVLMNTTTNGSGVATATYDFESNQPITGWIRKHSASPYYAQASIGGTLTSSPLDTTILMVPDE